LKAIPAEQKAVVERLEGELFGSKKLIEMRRRKQPAWAKVQGKLMGRNKSERELSSLESGTPEWIRTTDLLLRRQRANSYVVVFSVKILMELAEIAECSALFAHKLHTGSKARCANGNRTVTLHQITSVLTLAPGDFAERRTRKPYKLLEPPAGSNRRPADYETITGS
jgi:hypothetical protein